MRPYASMKTHVLRLVRPRVHLADELPFGPGKADLLRAIAQHGSISAAARALGMGMGMG